MDKETFDRYFVKTQYKIYPFDEDEEEEDEYSGEEPNWQLMGLPRPKQEPDVEIDFEWVDITIKKSHVWGVSTYDGETGIWVGSRSMVVNMSEEEAIQKFLIGDLDISK